MTDLLIRNVRPMGGAPTDVLIRGGRIEAIGADLAAVGVAVEDVAGEDVAGEDAEADGEEVDDEPQAVRESASRAAGRARVRMEGRAPGLDVRTVGRV